MKDKICVTLNKDHVFNCPVSTIAHSNENEVSQIEIKLEECLCDYWVFIDFEKPDGTKFKTPKLNVIGNVALYDIPNSLVDTKGTLKAQIVLQKENGEVWKSNVYSYYIKQSIDAIDDIPEDEREDFIAQAQKTLDDIENGLTPTIGENGNWFITGQDTGKPSQGEKGEKGEKGDAGSIKFIIVNELPTENIDDSAIYMKANQTGEEDNIYEEYVYVNGTWEHVGSASVEVDLNDYVKFTDYGTTSKAGVVKGSTDYGTYIRSNGVMQINKATNDDIDQKTNTFKPIVPSNLDYAVGCVLPVMTQAEYDALATKDENLYYFIAEE